MTTNSFIDRFIRRTIREKEFGRSVVIEPAITPDLLPENFPSTRNVRDFFSNDIALPITIQKNPKKNTEMNDIMRQENIESITKKKEVVLPKNLDEKVDTKSQNVPDLNKDNEHNLIHSKNENVENKKNTSLLGPNSKKENDSLKLPHDTESRTRKEILKKIESEMKQNNDNETDKKISFTQEQMKSNISKENVSEENISQNSSKNHTRENSSNNISGKNEINITETTISNVIQKGRSLEEYKMPNLIPISLIKQDKDNSAPLNDSARSPQDSVKIFEVSSEPMVTINIGRIEVRTFIPERQNVNKDNKLPAPNLSLKDYLKQRSKES